MISSDPLAQLSAKRRTYADLSRFISSRTSEVPNYSFLLGAGCSVSSGVRSASTLVEEWRKEVFQRLYPQDQYDEVSAKARLSKSEGVWYNFNREYSSLFEKNFDLPRQRRMFVEKEVSGKSPNLGYAYLIRLVDTGYINTLFTTNFDDLLTESFFQFSQNRPMICAHDSAISSVSVTSSRPKIIKLHGDYLFDDIKSTVRETESLEDNTRKKFVEFGRNFGLVVIGYSGCDRSIMDVLQYLLRGDDHFKHGVYWCIRKGDTPSDELIKLLWRDRVYFVEVDGFDEVMAQLHNDLIGASLPIDTRIVNDKPRTIIRGFCDNHYLQGSTSEIIKRDLEILERQNSREELFSTFRDLKNSSQSEDDELTDRETVVVLEIRQLIDSSSFNESRDRLRVELEKQPRPVLKERLYDLLVRTEELAGDVTAAIRVIDDLISLDPKDADNHIRKSYLLHDHNARIHALQQGLAASPYNHKIHNAILAALMDAKIAAIGFDAQQLADRIEDHFTKSIDCNPSLANWAWSMMSKHLADQSIPKEEFRRRIDAISAKCTRMDPTSVTALRATLAKLSKYKEDRNSSEADQLIVDVAACRQSKPHFAKYKYAWLQLDTLSSLQRRTELSQKISEMDIDPELCNRRDFLTRKAKHLIETSGDLDGAISAMRASLKADTFIEDAIQLAQYLAYKKDGDGIAAVISEYGHKFRPLERHQALRLEHRARGNVDASLSQLRAMNSKRMLGVSAKNEEIHDLLLLKKFGEAEDLAKNMLEQLNWNINHAELVINYELARSRRGEQAKRSRLNDVIEKSGREQAVACAHLLAGNPEKCKEILRTEIRQNRELPFIFDEWAIFSDEKGRKTLESALSGA